MRNVNRDEILLNFQELIAEHQFQTAVGLLTAAEPADQVGLLELSAPGLVEQLMHGLSRDDRAEVIAQLVPRARESLLRILGAPDGNGVEPVDGAIEGVLVARAAEQVLLDARAAAAAAETGVRSGNRQDFTIDDGHLRVGGRGAAVVTIYSAPTAQGQRALIDEFGIDEHTLASALDPDEVSRMETDDASGLVFIAWKRPQRSVPETSQLLGLTSMGFFLTADHLTIVTRDETPVLREGDRAASAQDLMLRIMASTVSEFSLDLKTLKRVSRDLGEQLARSIENRHLLPMFEISEKLVYEINALDANGGVLRRLRRHAPVLGLSDAGTDFLDDIIVDNTQCTSQARTFSTILAGLMDARGNLINNNMNVLLKNLTIVNVVFLPLGVIASMGGMSEFTMMIDDYSVDWRVAYPVASAAMVVLGFGLLKVVQRWVNRMFSS